MSAISAAAHDLDCQSSPGSGHSFEVLTRFVSAVVGGDDHARALLREAIFDGGYIDLPGERAKLIGFVRTHLVPRLLQFAQPGFLVAWMESVRRELGGSARSRAMSRVGGRSFEVGASSEASTRLTKRMAPVVLASIRPKRDELPKSERLGAVSSATVRETHAASAPVVIVAEESTARATLARAMLSSGIDVEALVTADELAAVLKRISPPAIVVVDYDAGARVTWAPTLTRRGIERAAKGREERLERVLDVVVSARVQPKVFVWTDQPSAKLESEFEAKGIRRFAKVSKEWSTKDVVEIVRSSVRGESGLSAASSAKVGRER